MPTFLTPKITLFYYFVQLAVKEYLYDFRVRILLLCFRIKNFLMAWRSSLTVLSIDDRCQCKKRATFVTSTIILKFCDQVLCEPNHRWKTKTKTHGSAQLRTLVKIMDYNHYFKVILFSNLGTKRLEKKISLVNVRMIYNFYLECFAQFSSIREFYY